MFRRDFVRALAAAGLTPAAAVAALPAPATSLDETAGSARYQDVELWWYGAAVREACEDCLRTHPYREHVTTTQWSLYESGAVVKSSDPFHFAPDWIRVAIRTDRDREITIELAIANRPSPFHVYQRVQETLGRALTEAVTGVRVPWPTCSDHACDPNSRSR